MTNVEDKVKKLLIINQDSFLPLLKNGENEVKTIKIKKILHPKTNEPRSFILIPNKCLLELIKHEPEYNSVFIDNCVQSNSNMHFATKFNVTYFIISTLYNNQTEYHSLDKLYVNDEIENKKIYLKEYINLNEIENIFDVKKEEEVQIKFNLGKCLEWLKSKVLKLDEFFKKNADNKKDLNSLKVSNENDFLINSFELIAQYINSSLCQLLTKELDLNELIENINPVECKRVKSSA